MDGAQKGYTHTNSTSIPDIPGTLNFGNLAYCLCGYLQNNIDEFRISKGIARWTENFTPPTAPFN
jgi:hypothetical protein